MEYNFKVEQGGYTFYVPDESYKGEIERGHSQPFIGDMDVLKEFHKLHPERNRYMIDVGAHIGLFSIPYSEIFDYVFAYEPYEENYEYLVRNISENGVENVFPIQEAIMSGANKVSVMGHDKDRLVSGKPRYSGMYTCVPDDKGDYIATTLDAHHLDETIDFIKIDVEGQEMSVLKTASRILAQHKPFLQIEIKNDFDFLPNRPSLGKIVGYLNKFGYEIFEIKVDYFFICTK